MQYVRGDRIFNSETGREVMWRGAGGSYLFHAGEDYQLAWQNHVPEMQAMHMNTMRLAFAFADSAPNPDYGHPSADILDFEKLDWILGFLEGYGIKVILDLHNWKDMYGDFGSDKIINDWVAVAEYYKDEPRIIAYELFNEPAEGCWAPWMTSRVDAVIAYKDLTDAVRAMDNLGRIVTWTAKYYLPSNFPEGVEEHLRPNLVYSWHNWWTNNESKYIFTPTQLAIGAAAYGVGGRKRLNAPFWNGEFGLAGGGNAPWDPTNIDNQICVELLRLCEEQVIGWNLWQGTMALDKPWGVFPYELNESLVRQPFVMTVPDITEYVVDMHGLDSYTPMELQMWHNNDYVTLKPGIIILLIVNHRLEDGTLEVVSEDKYVLTEERTFTNEEGTATHPGDWNMRIFPMAYIPKLPFTDNFEDLIYWTPLKGTWEAV